MLGVLRIVFNSIALYSHIHSQNEDMENRTLWIASFGRWLLAIKFEIILIPRFVCFFGWCSPIEVVCSHPVLYAVARGFGQILVVDSPATSYSLIFGVLPLQFLISAFIFCWKFLSPFLRFCRRGIEKLGVSVIEAHLVL
ncbi:hypothetical protein V6N13_039668 [Hibiscus sabdariffa]|uniref:Uncharacterized protein n=1 Tax=Hibiscus sabdariffa TaxID=183260 RepID=A0ABR2SUU1_9ROSI